VSAPTERTSEAVTESEAEAFYGFKVRDGETVLLHTVRPISLTANAVRFILGDGDGDGKPADPALQPPQPTEDGDGEGEG
jgi:hypothetical protein